MPSERLAARLPTFTYLSTLVTSRVLSFHKTLWSADGVHALARPFRRPHQPHQLHQPCITPSYHHPLRHRLARVQLEAPTVVKDLEFNNVPFPYLPEEVSQEHICSATRRGAS